VSCPFFWARQVATTSPSTTSVPGVGVRVCGGRASDPDPGQRRGYVETARPGGGHAEGIASAWCAGGFRPYCVEQIDFDVDLRELQGQDRLDVLCAFLRAIGRRIGKPVVMTPEGVEDVPVLGYDREVDRVVLFAEP
jgi:hypothetical protein